MRSNCVFEHLGPFLACIRCPMAYHRHDRCIPAGSVLLNNRWIICCEHKKPKSTKKTNTNFCFVCGHGKIFWYKQKKEEKKPEKTTKEKKKKEKQNMLIK